MKLVVFVLYAALDAITGCLISGPENVNISSSPGQTAIMHCSCADNQTRPQSISWAFHNAKRFTDLSPELTEGQMEFYSGRLQVVYPSAPASTTLHLSKLTVEDTGLYRCYMKSSDRTLVKNFKLHVQDGDEADDIPDDIPPDSSVPVWIIFLIGVLILLMLLGIGILSWRRANRESGGRSDNSGPVLANDEVTYSTVVHTPGAGAASRHTNTEENTEYSSIRIHQAD